MKMKHAAVCAVICNAAWAGAAHANEWVLGPAFKPGWKPEFTVAAIGGQMNPDSDLGDSDGYLGMEISLNCPWFQPPSGSIRQQFWLGRYESNGLELKGIEINPRYFVDMGSGFSFGVGPGFGYLQGDSQFANSVDMGTLQVGADLSYRAGAFYLGVGTRYAFTSNKYMGPGQEGADNWVVVGKVGVNF